MNPKIFSPKQEAELNKIIKESARRMDEYDLYNEYLTGKIDTKFVCDIMSTIACFIKENISEEETMEHLAQLFHPSSFQKVSTLMVYEHMQILKSKF